MSVSVSAKINPIRKSVDPTKVRIAEAGDMAAILTLCRQLAGENALFEMNEEKVTAVVERAVIGYIDPKTGQRSQDGLVGVIGRMGELEGMMMLKIGQFWYTDALHLEEIFSFVPPRYRRSDNAKKLIEWAKKMSDECGAPLFVGITSTIRTEAKVRLYRRMLGTWLGCFFIYGKAQSAHSEGQTEH